ncbi:DUF4349 domain-containing protein [Candidatus Microgenomates bacterium]|nr:DUF4349 domain-containing protein [Candidatus Microgenomates bacterium]
MKLVNWFLNNKLLVVLLLVIFYLLFFRNRGVVPLSLITSRTEMAPGIAMKSLPSFSDTGIYDAPPTTGGLNNRMVITENTLSMQVNNVASVLGEIRDAAQNLGGYMVESNLDRPDEAASGNITVRVPQTKMNEALSLFKGMAVKVVSENLRGTDVTDQYVDNEARLRILQNNKARFEEIMAKAVNVDEILRVQEQIFNIQNQIDGIKGQQEYLSKNSQMTRITIYLAIDELALPFSPDQPWRPEVVFKQAVRSLLLTGRSIFSLVIWLAVYSVVWLPILLVVLFFRKKITK